MTKLARFAFLQKYIARILFCLVVFFIFFYTKNAFAATVTWDGGGTEAGCGTGNANNWSCGANWWGDTAPGSSDIAQFTTTSAKDAILDAGFGGSVAGVTIASGYTGSISQQRSLTVGSSNFSIAGGTFSGDYSITLNGSFTQSGGIFVAPSTTFSVSSGFTQTSGTWLANNGTLKYNGAGTQTMDINSRLTIANLTIAKSNATVLVVASGDTVIATGTITLSDGDFNSGGTLYAEGDMSGATAFDGGSGVIIVSSSASQIITMPSGMALPGITLSATNTTFTLTGPATTTFGGASRLENGTFQINDANTDFQSTYVQSNGTYTGGGGWDIFASTFTLSGGTFTPDRSYVQIQSTMTVSGGTWSSSNNSFFDLNSTFTMSGAGTIFSAPSSTMFFSGSFTQSAGTFLHNNGTLTADGTGTQTMDINSRITFANLNLSKSNNTSFAIGSGDAVTVTGTITLGDGTFSTGGTLFAEGDISSVTTFDGGAGIIIVSSSASQTITIPSGMTLPGITLSATNTTFTLAGTATTTFGGTLRIESGTFEGNTEGISLPSNAFVQSGGTFHAGTKYLLFPSSFTLSGGTFVGPTVGNMDANSTFTESGGTFVSPPTILNFASNFTQSSGTFLHNNGTLTASGAGTQTMDINSRLTIANLTIAKSNATVLVVASGDTVIATGTITLSDGDFNSGGTLYAEGDMSGATAFDGGSGVIIVSSSASQIITMPSGMALPGITLSATNTTFTLTGPATTTFGGASRLENGTFQINDANTDFQSTYVQSNGTYTGGGGWDIFASTFTLSGGTFTPDRSYVQIQSTMTVSGGTWSSSNNSFFDLNSTFTMSGAGTIFSAPSSTMFFSGSFTQSAGTFLHNNGTLTADGTGTQTMDVNSTLTLANLSVAKSSGTTFVLGSNDTVTVTGTVRLVDGAYSNAGTLEAQGDIYEDSAFDGGTGAFTIDGTANQTFSGNATDSAGDLPPVTINKTGGTLTLGSGSLTTLRIDAANWTYTAGTVDPASSTVYFSGIMTVSSNGMSFDDVVVEAGTVTLGGPLDVNGNLRFLPASILAAGTNRVNVFGNWNNTTGTFSFSAGEIVQLDGGDQIITGSTTFYHLTKTVSSTATLTFPTGSSTVIFGTLNIQGSANNLLSIRSSVTGAQARINVAGTSTANFLDVEDSFNVASTTILAQNSTNSGNNTGWSFSSSNSAPTATSLSLTAARDGTGNVTVSFVANDADTNVLRTKVEYKSGTCASYTGQATTTLSSSVTATFSQSSITINNSSSTGFQVGNISTASGANTITLTWKSQSDVPTANGQYCLFVTTNDQTASSTVVSTTLTLDNVAPTTPGNITIGSTSTRQVYFKFGSASSDTNFSEYKIFYKAGSSGATQNDTAFTSTSDANLGSASYGSATSTRVGNLTTSTQYVANIWAYDTYGNVTTGTTEIAFYTMAAVPGASTLSVVSASTTAMTVVINSSTNPAAVTYAICRTSDGSACVGGGYLQSTGQLGASPAYQSYSAWGGSTGQAVMNLSVDTQYQFLVEAKNGDGVTTTLSTGSSAVYTLAATPGTPAASIVSASTTALTVVLDASTNPAAATYAVCRTTDGSTCVANTYIQTNGALGSSPFYDTYTNWGGASGTTTINLSSNTSYKFLAEARNGDNVSTTLSSASTAVATNAAQVTALAAADGTTTSTIQIQLSWTSNGQTGMKIERDTSCDGSYDLTMYDSASTNDTSPTTTARSLSGNTCYQFRISSYNLDGVLNSTSIAASSQITTPPDQGSGLMALIANRAADQITWTFSSISAATSYRLYVNSTGALIGTGTDASTGVAHSSLSPNTQDSVVVRAANSNGQGIASDASSTYTLANPPSGVSVSGLGTTYATVSWNLNSNPGTTEFYVYDANATSRNSGWVNRTNYQFTDLSASTNYTFSVKSRNSDEIETSAASASGQTASSGSSGQNGGGNSGGGGSSGGTVSNGGGNVDTSGCLRLGATPLISPIDGLRVNTDEVVGLSGRTSADAHYATVRADPDHATVTIQYNDCLTHITLSSLRIAADLGKLPVPNGTYAATVDLTRGIPKNVDVNTDAITDVRMTYLGLAQSVPGYRITHFTDPGDFKKFVWINGGAYEANTRSVNLTVNATQVASMMISNTDQFVTSTAVPFQSSVPWQLTPGSGTKKVSIRLVAADGTFQDINDTIFYAPDAVPPPGLALPSPSTPAPIAAPVEPSGPFLTTMKPGDSNTSVQELQTFLRRLGFFTYPSDTGKFGSVTQTAVMKFQRANALKITGVVDDATLTALNRLATSESGEPLSPPPPTQAFTRTFKRGSSGSDVIALQQLLLQFGFFPASVKQNNFFGPTTESSVKSLQRSNNLTVNGAVDADTLNLLNQIASGELTPNSPAAALPVLVSSPPKSSTPKPSVPKTTPAPPLTVSTGFTRVLKRGSNGADVYALQQLLLRFRFFPPSVPPNGFFGATTEQSVRSFQAANGLPATGIVNGATLNLLNSHR